MSESPLFKPSFAVVGCGKVGTLMAVFLSRTGYRAAAAASRSRSSAQRTAGLCGAENFGTRPWEHTRKADLVLITTPDGEIEPTCLRIAENGGFAPDTVVLHCSGALPSTILGAARGAGAAVGSLHPLQSFASADAGANPFAGIVFAVEGDRPAVEAARRIALDLEGKHIVLNTEGKALYHAAAVVASNYLVSLVDMATGLLSSAGISERQAPEVLAPLMAGTLANIGQLGVPAALTGPVARGDVATVRRHFEEIRRKAPVLLDLYTTLGRHTVDVALRGGHISAETGAKILSLLEMQRPPK